jgi:phosphoglycolate phosphatase-like HAD superfamily hydrolase
MKRLILFDIDGTLLRGGPARDAFELALMEAYGTAGPIADHEFSGKTDPQIARELMVRAGLDHGTIDQGLPVLYRHYIAELEARLPARPTQILPGVHELLALLGMEADTALGLLTGNIEPGAELKLASAAIETRFEVGAFGSDGEEREALPAVALERAADRWQRAFDPAEVVIVGDTPRDVSCGRSAGMRTLAVSTGQYSTQDLNKTGADWVFEGLDDPRVADALLGVRR